MRIRESLATLLVVVSLAAPAAAQSAPVQSDQDILIKLERDWDAALRHNDVAFIDRVLAADFIVTYDDGKRGDRRTELEFARTYNQQADATLDEFIVREYGNTALVWFTLHLVGPINGRTTELTFRFVDVFVLRDARWQCVSSQSTRVVEPQ